MHGDSGQQGRATVGRVAVAGQAGARVLANSSWRTRKCIIRRASHGCRVPPAGPGGATAEGAADPECRMGCEAAENEQRR